MYHNLHAFWMAALSNRFSQFTTTVYPRGSRENCNEFFWWNVPSIDNSFTYYVDNCTLLPPSPHTLQLRTFVYTWTPNLKCAVVLHCISMCIDVSVSRNNNTQDTNVFPHCSTTWSQQFLIPLGRWGVMTSSWNGRSCQHTKFWDIYDSSCYIHMPFPYSKRVHFSSVVAVVLPFSLLFDLGKRIVNHYVPQYAPIMGVGNSNHLSQWITTIYSRESKENVNWFIQWIVFR